MLAAWLLLAQAAAQRKHGQKLSRLPVFFPLFWGTLVWVNSTCVCVCARVIKILLLGRQLIEASLVCTAHVLLVPVRPRRVRAHVRVQFTPDLHAPHVLVVPFALCLSGMHGRPHVCATDH